MKPKYNRILALISVILVGLFSGYLLFGNEDTPLPPNNPDENTPLPPNNPDENTPLPPNNPEYPHIYVTIVMHSEVASVGKDENYEFYYPDYSSDVETYNDARKGLFEMVEMLKEEDVKFDFQPDSNFLEAVKLYDSGTSKTNGENILKYIVEQGFDVDAHHHPSKFYSYADVAYVIKELTGKETGVVGGFIYYPLKDSEFDEVIGTIKGKKYSTSWIPTILWGGGISGHGDIGEIADTEISGIWRPKTSTDFFSDKPGNLPDVGSYTSDAEGVLDLLEKANSGELNPDKIYTANIMTNHRDIDNSDYQQYIDNVQNDIQEIKAKDTNNLIVWVTITEVVNIWEEDYNSVPNTYYAEGFEPF